MVQFHFEISISIVLDTLSKKSSAKYWKSNNPALKACHYGLSLEVKILQFKGTDTRSVILFQNLL
jgi:hypothetical protein